MTTMTTTTMTTKMTKTLTSNEGIAAVSQDNYAILKEMPVVVKQKVLKPKNPRKKKSVEVVKIHLKNTVYGSGYNEKTWYE